MRSLPALLLVLVLLTMGCTTAPKQEVVTLPPATTIVATPVPEPTITRPLPGVDPIIGSWDNGLVFNPDGTVGSGGNMTWKANSMVADSYFVTTVVKGVMDEKGVVIVSPSITSKEYIYHPGSDTLHIRDSPGGFRRVLSVPAASAAAPL